MNPNVLHRWVTEHQRYGKNTLQGGEAAPARETIDMTPANWIALKPLPLTDSSKAMVPTPSIGAAERHETGGTIQVQLAGRGIQMMVEVAPHNFEFVTRQTLICPFTVRTHAGVECLPV